MKLKLTTGKRYTILRVLASLSQPDVNKALNRSTSWCSQLEGEHFALSIEQAVKLAKLYNVTLGQLIGVESIELTILAE